MTSSPRMMRPTEGPSPDGEDLHCLFTESPSLFVSAFTLRPTRFAGDRIGSRCSERLPCIRLVSSRGFFPGRTVRCFQLRKPTNRLISSMDSCRTVGSNIYSVHHRQSSFSGAFRQLDDLHTLQRHRSRSFIQFFPPPNQGRAPLISSNLRSDTRRPTGNNNPRKTGWPLWNLVRRSAAGGKQRGGARPRQRPEVANGSPARRTNMELQGTRKA